MSVALTIDVRDVDWERLEYELDVAYDTAAKLWGDAEYFRALLAVGHAVLDQAREAGLLEEVGYEPDDA